MEDDSKSVIDTVGSITATDFLIIEDGDSDEVILQKSGFEEKDLRDFDEEGYSSN